MKAVGRKENACIKSAEEQTVEDVLQIFLTAAAVGGDFTHVQCVLLSSAREVARSAIFLPMPSV
jgi:hypothetical protein